jgi:hypothetical protein
MRALVIYESMYGNTHMVADAIVRGLADEGTDAVAISVAAATPEKVVGTDLVVVGGPTHVHSMSRESTRAAAVENANKPASDLHLDPGAEGEGLREWFDSLPTGIEAGTAGAAAAFDTRIHRTAALTGRASKGISKRLQHHGYTEVVEPESFFVDPDVLEPGEEQRAREWGQHLACALGDHMDSLRLAQRPDH